jgi:Ca-activated chloride channel family protein
VVIKMSTQQSNVITQLMGDFTLDSFINNFHFIRPWWLLAFFALYLVIHLLKKIRYYQSPWQHFLPAHLANALLENSHNTDNSSGAVAPTAQGRFWLKPFIIGSCIIIALAGPAWQKLPQPVYQLERGAVLIMDMSYSMYATDLKPNRLTRSRYKAVDLLKKINEGDVGLIAYAGDAFIISPLTQDIKNIELLLPSLSPDIMPSHGANALAALMLADQTLKNSGHVSGDIYWFTDDVEQDEMSDIYAWANDNGHNLNILGVGSKAGAPIRLSGGKLLKDNKGAIVIPKLPEGRLSAIAQRARGIYHTMTNDDADIKALTAHLSVGLDDKIDSATSSSAAKDEQSKQALQGDQYQEQGPLLLIIILPLLLSYFRRGTSILSLSALAPLTVVIGLMSMTPINSYAEEANIDNSVTAKSQTTSDAKQLWNNLWQTSDQQAQAHYQKENYQQAAQQFTDSQWQGSAHYKAGDYQQALDAFKQIDSAQSLYNQGNALAQLQQVDDAIEAYKNALKKDPNLADAKDNLAKLEALKKQQEHSKKDSSEQSKDGEQNEQDNQQDKKGDQQKQDAEQQSQDQSKDQQGEQEQGDQQGDPQQSDDAQKPQDESEQQSQQNDAEKSEEEQKEQEEKSQQAKKTDEQEQPGDKKSLAQQASDKKAQETQQKHQQLLNKVTDDPYLLLRNKMRLEYQKRRQEAGPPGETKKW